MKVFDTEYELRELAQPEKDEHHRQLGDFVSQFAGVESAVHVLAATLIEDPTVAGCVLRDVPLGRTVDLAREIGRAKHGGSPHFAELEAALLQIKECATVRNRLLHSMLVPVRFGADGPSGLWAFSARRPALPRATLDEIASARSALGSATQNLMIAMLLLGLIKMPPEIAKMLDRKEPDK